ncbi:uncharacterized protein LACBIDRAFT_323131 [Laccaria bicolor S238N-H82]|uniref:Predicted protein n=1 Tax=Laccaria bicolor (strain S238N-H82 / ATCC MYA-4686) TaxID=486041 RepID=B0CZ79_LACBS|nr:uncharacterized protein LACBIDRAFT_323131 [Laccaria bicolor S238N-H82]EDR12103.1 predicted protein [Laccaria bicolor S238N-H82]|eukprot:XP_001876367.1 predicted protein [Laccaria bicolor S238N-H82]
MALASPTLVRVSGLWYDDGNIVFQAESSLFRVSLGVLAAHSPIFDDLLKLPQSQDQEMYEDCPLMVLHDKAEDLANFLRAVYYCGFFEPPPSKTTIDIVAGVLRLSTKYEVSYLRQHALRHLDTLMCNTLQDFDALKSKKTIQSTESFSFFIADLVHEMDLPWLLPPFLYNCTLNIKKVAMGHTYRGEERCMNSSQQLACVKALQPLEKWYKGDILGFLYWTDVDGCESPAQCDEGRLKLACSSFDAHHCALVPFSGLIGENVRDFVCTTCCTASRDAHSAARDALWEALPGLFGLPPWETLRALREHALTSSDASSEMEPIKTTTRPEIEDESEPPLSLFH